MRVSDAKVELKIKPRGVRKSRIPDCHPDRPHRALGLCEQCWHIDYRKRCRESNPTWNKRQADRVSDWRKKNRHEINLRYACKQKGITLEDFYAMLKSQSGKCFICKDIMDRICIDHDHETGRARKLLCHNCNVGLGHFRDSPELLLEAARYIEMHRQIKPSE